MLFTASYGPNHTCQNTKRLVKNCGLFAPSRKLNKRYEKLDAKDRINNFEES